MKLVIISLFIILGFSLAFGVGQIDIAYSPYTISNPGSYIVVRDLNTLRFLNAITIQTSNVFLDLNGHTLAGTGITFAGTTTYGIYGDTTNNNITIINGTIQNGLRGGIILGGNRISISQVKTYINGNEGIKVGNYSIVADCLVDSNGTDGIKTGTFSKILNCTITGNKNNGLICGDYGIIDNCIISNNTAGGIISGNKGTIKNNTVTYNGSNLNITGINAGYGSIITGNSCQNNGYNGIQSSYGSTITGNLCQYNNWDGVSVTDQCTLIGNTVNYNNGRGIEANNYCTIKDNTVSGNYHSDGISTGNSCTIKDNTVTGNYYSGIVVNNYNQIIGNTISDQTSYSAYGIICEGYNNRIDSNHICNNYFGIVSNSLNNWCGRNTFRMNTSNSAGVPITDPGTGFSNFTTF